MTFFIIGIIDLVGGLIFLSSPSIPLFNFFQYFAYFLLFKGLWSIISDLIYILSK